MRTIRQIAAWLRGRLAQERGAVLVIVAVMFPVLIASVVIAIDLGTLFRAKQQAQTAADAGALAGAQDIYANSAVPASTVTTDAGTLVNDNDSGASNTTTTGTPSNPSAVQVTVSQSVPLEFANLLGIHIGRVSATAVASSNLADALGYFDKDAGSSSDADDGSQTGDGWANFCAPDAGHTVSSGSTAGQYTSSVTSTGAGAGTGSDSPNYQPNYTSSNPSSSYASGNEATDDPGRCPVGGANTGLDNWDVAHGGVDVALENQFPSPNDNGDQMVDLTGTCVEYGPGVNYPDGHSYKSGSTTVTSTVINQELPQQLGISGLTFDGYCENNADGEIEDKIPTIKGQTYTVSFEMTQNSGPPYTKQMMALVSDTDLKELPAVADTNGNDSEYAASTNQYSSTYDPFGAYGTTYPLEADSAAWNGLLEHIEYTYTAPDNQETWIPETFTFTADNKISDYTYLGFASMDDCIPDWDTASNGSGASTASVSTSNTFITPTTSVNALNGGNECFFGPALSDVTVTSNGVPVALSQ